MNHSAKGLNSVSGQTSLMLESLCREMVVKFGLSGIGNDSATNIERSPGTSAGQKEIFAVWFPMVPYASLALAAMATPTAGHGLVGGCSVSMFFVRNFHLGGQVGRQGGATEDSQGGVVWMVVLLRIHMERYGVVIMDLMRGYEW